MSNTGKFAISLPDNLNNYKENHQVVLINDEKENNNKILKKDLKNKSLKTLKKRSQSQFFGSNSSNCRKLLNNLKQNDLILLTNCENNRKFLIEEEEKIKLENSDTDSGLFSATEESIDPFRLELIKKAKEMSITRSLKIDEIEKNRNRSFSITNNNNNKRTSLPRVKSNRLSLISYQSDDLKQANSNSNNNNESDFSKSIRFEMPSLIEINELTSSTTINMTAVNNTNKNEVSNLNETEESESTNLTNITNTHNANNMPSSSVNISNNEPNTKAQILTSLEYLMNNSKSNVFNTTVAIANIAAAAAASDSNLITSDTETALQNFFMDLVIPNVELNNSVSNETSTDLALLWLNQQHLAENSNTNYLNGGSVCLINNDGTASAIQELNSSGFNLNNMNNKQTNDQIMRTCMGYLDYINKKHIKERRTQIIRNKISGFVLLTLVFLMVFGLGLIMIYCLTDALAHIIKTHKYRSSSVYDIKEEDMSTTTSQEQDNNKSVSSPLVHLNLVSNQNVFNPLVKITNETRFKQDDLNAAIKSELKYEIKNFALKLIDKMTRNLEINLKEENITQIGNIMFNLTVVALTSNFQHDENASDDESTELHYFRYIDEIN